VTAHPHPGERATAATAATAQVNGHDPVAAPGPGSATDPLPATDHEPLTRDVAPVAPVAPSGTPEPASSDHDPEEWAGRARMAAARQAAGLDLSDDDRRALERQDTGR
jgi:hypothetical protein